MGTDEKIQKEIFEGRIKNTSDLKGEFVDFKEKVKELNVARSDLLNKNGTSWCGLVGNYRLVRESLDDQWVVSEVGQADSLEVMTPIGISLESSSREKFAQRPTFPDCD